MHNSLERGGDKERGFNISETGDEEIERLILIREIVSGLEREDPVIINLGREPEIGKGHADAVVVSFETLEQIPREEQKQKITEAHDLLKPLGLLIASIPYPYSFDQDGKRIGASSNQSHNYEPSAEEVAGWATETGFRTEVRYGQSWVPRRGVEMALKLEKQLAEFEVPAWEKYIKDLSYFRNPKPVIMTETEPDGRIPLTQILVFKKL